VASQYHPKLVRRSGVDRYRKSIVPHHL